MNLASKLKALPERLLKDYGAFKRKTHVYVSCYHSNQNGQLITTNSISVFVWNLIQQFDFGDVMEIEAHRY